MRLGPFLAVLRYDLRILAASWLVRLWLGGSVLLALLMLASGWKGLPSSHLIAMLLFPYLVFPWFLVVMVLGVDPVSGARLDALADGILSRPVTRLEYLLASWAARLVVVQGVFLAVVVPLIAWVAAVERKATADQVTLFGAIAALAVVGLVLTLQVSLGYLLGTVLRRPLLAIVVLLFVWYPSDLILHRLSIEQFSTISLSQAMPQLLRAHWRDRGGIGAAAVAREISALADHTTQFLSGLGGGVPSAPRKSNFFDRGRYDDFSLVRVALGYGIPTLLCLVLTALCFCRRDL
jgi:ABC-type transport system involved in multi-copper enzyme maturation permease subunit